MEVKQLVARLNDLLQPDHFQDYCPNGLQIVGQDKFTKIITGVSLNQALIDLAVLHNAKVIIVHHGIFWHKSSYSLTGIKYSRVAKLIKNDINLIAYHLPLDNQPHFGNNVELAKLLDFEVSGHAGAQDLLWYGNLRVPMTLSQLTNRYQELTNHNPLSFGKDDKMIKKIAWCTGGADSMFEEAIDLGVDCFITGEVNEQIMGLSEESGVAFIAGGHYVTERYGIMALTKHLQSLGYDAEFMELYNPV